MMRKRLTQTISVFLVAALAVGLTACGGTKTNGAGSAAADEDETTIGIVVKTSENAHFQDMAYGAMLAGKELGVKVMVDYTNAESEIDEQNQKCESMVSKGVDGLILAANESSSMSPAVEAAHNAGIPFVAVDTEITWNDTWGDEQDAAVRKSYLPTFVAEDYTQTAYELAKHVFDSAGGKGKVIILRGVDAASSSQDRTAGFMKAIDEYPGIELVDSQSANFSQDEANQTMGNLIQTHRDVDIVLCCSDLMAVGAVNAIKDAGVEVGGANGVKVGGLDGNVLALESIKNGEMCATLYDWTILQGYYSVQYAYDLIQGKEVPEETLVPCTVVSAENVDEFLPHGEEVDAWTMGEEIAEIPDLIAEFLEKGKALLSTP